MNNHYFDRHIAHEELREIIKKSLEVDMDLSFGDLMSDSSDIAAITHKPNFLHDTRFPGMIACVGSPMDTNPLTKALEFANAEMTRSLWNRDSIFNKSLQDNVFEIKMWDEIESRNYSYDYDTNGKNKVWDGLGDKEFSVSTRLAFHDKPLLTDMLLNKIQSKKKS